LVIEKQKLKTSISIERNYNQKFMETVREHPKAKKEIAQEEKARRGNDPLCYTYEQFKADIRNYAPKKEFRPSLFCGCACPEGSISVIAARPAGGKTSSMINIVRETLTLNADTETADGRKILYVNLEVNPRQILINLHLSCIYGVATPEERERLSQIKKN
jgi:hypothetical protein